MRRYIVREYDGTSGDRREYEVEADSPDEAMQKAVETKNLRVGLRDYKVYELRGIFRLEPGTTVRQVGWRPSDVDPPKYATRPPDPPARPPGRPGP